MKKLKTILIISGLFIIFSKGVYASNAEIGIFNQNGQTVVSGTADGKGEISVSVFNAGNTYKDAENMVPGALVYANQLSTGENGEFEFTVNMSGYATGEYGIAVYQNGNKILNRMFVYADKDDNRSAIEGLNSAAAGGNADAAAQYIRDNKAALEFSSDYDDIVSLSGASALIIQSAPFVTTDKAACVKAYRKAMLAQAFSERKITDIRTVENTLDILAENPLKAVYEEKYMTDTVKNSIAGKISSFAPYASISAFNDAVYQSVVLSVVKNPTGAGDISSVITALYPDFPSRLLTSTICRGVSNKDYASISALQTAMENLYKGSQSGSGGGSVSSGGGSSGFGGKPFTASSVNDIISDNIPKQSLFSDIENVSWAKEAIEGLAAKGVISGKDNNKFYPDDAITREEFLKIIVLVFDIPESEKAQHQFNDADSNEWYYPYVQRAYAAGIVNGISEDMFGIGMPITRQDASVMLNNCMKKYSTDQSDTQDFTDSAEISDYAVEAVNYMRGAGIISGYDDGTFRPRNNITRAEAAKIIYAAAERTDEI